LAGPTQLASPPPVCLPHDQLWHTDPFDVYNGGRRDWIRFVDDAVTSSNPVAGLESHFDGWGCNTRHLSAQGSAVRYFGQASAQGDCNGAPAFGSVTVVLPQDVVLDSVSVSHGLQVFSGGKGSYFVAVCPPLGGSGTGYLDWKTKPLPSRYWGGTVTVETWSLSSGSWVPTVEYNRLRVK
jgi:hypothetical protein